MIIGVITIVGLIVTRMPWAMRASLPLPDEIVLPDGVAAQAFTQGATWFAVVTTDDRILIYNRKTGVMVQDIAVNIAGSAD